MAAAQCISSPVKPTLSHRETIEEAAENIRTLVHDITTGTIASVFPHESEHADAPCDSPTSLTFLLLPISLSTHNILSSPSHYATYTVQMSSDVKSPMSRGRVAFIGNMTLLSHPTPDEDARLSKCYTSYHPDAKSWLPSTPDAPHFSVWARFDIEDIYYVGGFGDVHYIGHVPVELYAGKKQGFQIQA
ncbi:hypothetical protein P7C73_g5869, partial [Tremellales sp. Uapishka_1]